MNLIHNPRRKVSYRWHCPLPNQSKFLKQIGKYSLVKKPQVEIALKFLETRGEVRLSDNNHRLRVEYYSMMRRLNQKGSSSLN